MKASVVIPVRNGAETLQLCLNALENQDISRDNYEIIVINDGSTDNTAEIVQQYEQVRLLEQPPMGPAAARNLGIEAASGEWILFTDADCIPSTSWISTLLAATEAPRAAGGKGTYSTRQTSLVARFVQIEYETKYRRMKHAQSIDFVDTYSAIYRRKVLQDIGGFDASLPSTSLEDQELSFRVAEAGHKLVFVPGAVVQHVHADNVVWYARKKFSIGYWKARILQLHPGKTASDSHTPQQQKLQMAFAALLVPIAIATCVFPHLWPITTMIIASFAVSSMTFFAYAWKHDHPVAIVAPLLLLVRALALGMGLAKGVWAFWIRKKAPNP